MKRKEKNSFDTTVESFKDMGADCLFLSHFDPFEDGGMVTGEACNNKTKTTWAMSMVSSIEEAMECKYPICYDNKDKKLITYIEKHRKKK